MYDVCLVFKLEGEYVGWSPPTAYEPLMHGVTLGVPGAIINVLIVGDFVTITIVGDMDGVPLWTMVGKVVGVLVGEVVATSVGIPVGTLLGEFVGKVVGASVG